MSQFMLSQKVIFRDMVGRNTPNPRIEDVICTICLPEKSGDHSKTWIFNPARNYSHWVADSNLKSIT